MSECKHDTAKYLDEAGHHKAYVKRGEAKLKDVKARLKAALALQPKRPKRITMPCEVWYGPRQPLDVNVSNDE